MKIGPSLFSLKTLDLIPIVSLVANLVHMVAKAIFLSYASVEYATYLKSKSYTKCFLDAIPFVALLAHMYPATPPKTRNSAPRGTGAPPPKMGSLDTPQRAADSSATPTSLQAVKSPLSPKLAPLSPPNLTPPITPPPDIHEPPSSTPVTVIRKHTRRLSLDGAPPFSPITEEMETSSPSQPPLGARRRSHSCPPRPSFSFDVFIEKVIDQELTKEDLLTYKSDLLQLSEDEAWQLVCHFPLVVQFLNVELLKTSEKIHHLVNQMYINAQDGSEIEQVLKKAKDLFCS